MDDLNRHQKADVSAQADKGSWHSGLADGPTGKKRSSPRPETSTRRRTRERACERDQDRASEPMEDEGSS